MWVDTHIITCVFCVQFDMAVGEDLSLLVGAISDQLKNTTAVVNSCSYSSYCKSVSVKPQCNSFLMHNMNPVKHSVWEEDLWCQFGVPKSDVIAVAVLVEVWSF